MSRSHGLVRVPETGLRGHSEVSQGGGPAWLLGSSGIHRQCQMTLLIGYCLAAVGKDSAERYVCLEAALSARCGAAHPAAGPPAPAACGDVAGRRRAAWLAGWLSCPDTEMII